MSDKFCLKWNDFESNVSKSFGLLRREEYLHDVTLVCDDSTQVSAHKLVLSACSEYFKTLFKNSAFHHQNTLICLNGVTSNELKNILDYMYNGETNIFQDDLDHFLETAQRFKLSGLLKNSNIEEKTSDELIKKETFDEAKRNHDKLPLITNTEDHSEINRIINEYIEVCPDGSFNCTFCGKGTKTGRFNDKGPIRIHIETHLEGLSYKCSICDKTFNTRSSVSMHKYRNHKK